MRNSQRVALFILACTVPTAIVCVRNVLPRAEPPPLPNFPILFPKPNGQNGYEDFVMAADLTSSNANWLKYENIYNENPGPTPEMWRELLADPTVQRTLALLRLGLRKRIAPPRDSPDLQTLYPELKVFRSVARLLNVEMEEMFATGETSKAIDCLSDALDFGRDVQSGAGLGGVGGVVGLYIENISLHTFSNYLNQLTIADCNKLIRIVNNHLKLKDPQFSLISTERSIFLRSLRKYRTNAMTLLDAINPGPNASVSEKDDYSTMYRLIKENPESGSVIFDQSAQLIAKHYDLTLAEIRRPVWERKYPEPLERKSPASKLAFAFCPPSYSPMGGRFASNRMMVQMLGVQAAVLRHLKLRNRLPENLDELKLGNLAIDLFNGKPLAYMPSGGKAFTISSIGAFDPGDWKRPSTGKRVPIIALYPPQIKP